MDNLIFDRLSNDVDNALNNPNSTRDLKGAYNYSDLNRVESWCEYLQHFLEIWGFKKELIVKKDWNIRDYPTRTEIDRIRNNINTLKSFCQAIQTENILYNNTLNYEQANALEKIMYDIVQHIETNSRTDDFDYYVAIFSMCEKFYDMNINEDVLYKYRETKQNNEIGITVTKNSFCDFNLDVHKWEKDSKTSMFLAAALRAIIKVETTLNQESYDVNRNIESSYNYGLYITTNKFIDMEVI